jgi:hypothetical protein
MPRSRTCVKPFFTIRLAELPEEINPCLIKGTSRGPYKRAEINFLMF